MRLHNGFKLYSDGGFTLIELIVVLVILAVLMVIVIPPVNHWINKARYKQFEIDVKNVKQAAISVTNEYYAFGKDICYVEDEDKDDFRVIEKIESLCGCRGNVILLKSENGTITVLGYEDKKAKKGYLYHYDTLTGEIQEETFNYKLYRILR